MRRSRTTFLFFMMAAAALSVLTVAQRARSQESSDSDSASLNTIVNRMEEAQLKNRQNYRAYTMTRDYRLYGGEDQKPNSEVIADVHFVPPDRKTFEIEKVQGSDRGEKVVRHVLESESRMASQNAPGAISTGNYDFKLLGEEAIEGQPSYVLQLLPKREEKTLIRGRVWVDKNSYLVHRVQGEMAKSPSWWLKKVDMTVDFSNAAGMWLQTGTRAVADVRLVGKHTFTSRLLKIQTADEVATRFSSLPPNSFAVYKSTAYKPHARGPAQARGASPVATPAERTAASKHRRPLSPVPAVVGTGVLIPR